MRILAVIALFLCSSTIGLAGSNFSGSRLAQAASQQLQHLLEPDAELILQQQVKDVSFSQDGVRAAIQLPTDDIVSFATVKVQFSHSGKVLRTLDIPYSVIRYIDVVVATRDLRQGQTIQAQDVATQRVRMVRADQTSDKVSYILGYKLRHNVSKGDVVDEQTLITGNGVTRGQPVTIVVTSGAIEVRARGRALEDGEPGEYIRAVRVGTRNPITVQVIDAGRVSISMELVSR